jgi:hypothetical protein
VAASLVAWVAVASLLLAACSGAGTTNPPPVEVIALQGLWRVQPDAGTPYGAGGTTTLQFGASATGTATFLSRSDANGITTCARHVYAALSENVVLLDGDYYEATAVGADRIELDNDDAGLVLTRVSGAPPVAPCTAAQAVQVARLGVGVGSWSTLDAFQSRLYFNTNGAGNPVVGYDTVTGVLGPLRTYAGSHDHVVAARSDDEFYGHCACGNVTTLERFHIGTTPALASIVTTADLGVFLGVQYGFFATGSVTIGGRAYDQPGVNFVLTLHADTLALQSQREVLPGAYLTDATTFDGKLAALVGDAIVIIGADGLAEETIALEGALSGFPRGLTAIGSTFYLLDSAADGDALLYAVALP